MRLDAWIGWWAHQDSNLGPADYENETRKIAKCLEPLRNPHNLLDRNRSPKIASFVCVGVRLCACVSFNSRTT